MKSKLCCAFVLLLGLVPCAEAKPDTVPSPVQPGIISHETEVTERLPQRLTPDYSQGSVAVFSGDSLVREPDATNNQGTVASQPPAQAAPLAIDVYSLSPSAHLLALPSGGRSHNAPPATGMRPSYANNGAGEGAANQQRMSRSLPPEWQGLIREASQIFGLEEGLLMAVIRVESGFDAWAVSSAGAQGAMQIMPHTQRELGLIDPFDPRANIYAGAEYLLRQIQRFGDMELALAAYNSGPANVEKYGGIPPFTETQQYVKRVMKLWQASQ